MKEISAKNYYLNEFSYDDGEYEITFNIIDIDFVNQTITVAITRCGKITQDSFHYSATKTVSCISSTVCSMKTRSQ